MKETFKVETITPALAKQYLELNIANRPVSRGTVASYVEAMRAGAWLMNAEAIKFDWNGRLVDGQHRLAAVEKSGVPVRMLVARGLDPEVFKTLDTGHKRTAGDVLAIKGVKNALQVAVGLRLLHRAVESSFRQKTRITNTQIDELRLQHPRFLELAEEASHSPYSSPHLQAGALMYAFYMACHVDESRARSFFRTLGGRPEAGQPALFQAERLRDRLASTMEEVVKPSSKVRLAWLIQAWNATIAGRPVTQFSRVLTELPDWDPFPRFAPVTRKRAAG